MSGQFHASRLHEHTLPTPMMNRLDPTGGLTCLLLHLADMITGGQDRTMLDLDMVPSAHGRDLPAAHLLGVDQGSLPMGR